MSSRRTFLQRALALGASSAAMTQLGLSQPQTMESMPGMAMPHHHQHSAHSDAATPFLPVNNLDAPKLPFTVDNGVKVFHLIAEPVKQELIPGRVVDLWGYNGSAPGPMIEVQEGDRVRIIVENHLPEMTAMHWHGLEISNAMDGVPGISQPPIPPGGRFVYEFTLNQNGTCFYHSHLTMQEMMGMIGAFIIHPRRPYHPPVQQDFAVILQEYAILPNSTVPNSMKMEFNWLTFNGKAGPATTPLVVRHGDRVRIRLMNLGMDHHPIHLHGHQFWITGTESGRQPESNWVRRNTVLVGVAQAYDIEFDAVNPGEWMLHCHLPHHMMNNMVTMVGPMMDAMTSRKAQSVPGFPQDALMEGPMMDMDEQVEKPENYGLPQGWSRFMQGMMTLVRVLPPKQYEHIQKLKAQQASSRRKPQAPMPMNMPGMTQGGRE